MNLNKRIISNNDDKPFHSSGYAKIASGNRIGSVSAVSFGQRQQIDNSRSTVDLYKRSTIGNSYGVLRAKKFTRPSFNHDTNSTDKVGDKKSSLQQFNSVAPNKGRFNEPSGRGYNPYS